MSDLREAIVRAIRETRNVGLPTETIADAALAAIDAAGFAVVPREATEEMIDVMFSSPRRLCKTIDEDRCLLREDWTAMLAKAAKP